MNPNIKKEFYGNRTNITKDEGTYFHKLSIIKILMWFIISFFLFWFLPSSLYLISSFFFYYLIFSYLSTLLFLFLPFFLHSLHPYFLNFPAAMEIPCNSGSYSFAGSASCSPCPIGTYIRACSRLEYNGLVQDINNTGNKIHRSLLLFYLLFYR